MSKYSGEWLKGCKESLGLSCVLELFPPQELVKYLGGEGGGGVIYSLWGYF